MPDISYTPTTWADAPATVTPIDAADLNHLEAGVVAATGQANAAYDVAVGTANQLGTVAVLPPGSLMVAHITTSNYNTVARPTSRTDVTVWWLGSDAAHAPANALVGDPWDHT